MGRARCGYRTRLLPNGFEHSVSRTEDDLQAVARTNRVSVGARNRLMLSGRYRRRRHRYPWYFCRFSWQRLLSRLSFLLARSLSF